MKTPAFSVLTICGLEELDLHGARGVTHVLSILDPDWLEPPAFQAFAPHARVTLYFHDAIEPGPGIILPEVADVEAILGFGRDIGDDLGHLLIHCHAGISRSQAAAAILMCQHAPGQEEAAFLRLLDLRKHGWPNTRMVEFADQLLQRDGALMRGLLVYRRALIDAKPHLKEVIRNIGRGHEIPA
jgi:predicted protein tyrosine phosphatase